MAADPLTGRAIVRGGCYFESPGAPCASVAGETLAWNGTEWEPGAEPPELSLAGAAATVDPVRRRIVLVGGTASPGALQDTTFEHDGVRWARVAPTATPPAQLVSHLAYDRDRRVVVLFDNEGGNAQTWEWDGAWHLRDVAVAPSPRRGSALVYDAARHRTVLFGGAATQAPTTADGHFDDTWEWDGLQWTERTPAHRPPGRVYHAIAYDAARERVVLFNVVTITTLAIGIAALYLALVLILALAAAVTIPPAAFEKQVSASPTVGEYARLAWFAASVATVGGALGSLVESDQAVRDAAYRPRGGRQEASAGD